jgi:hypothetical protein
VVARFGPGLSHNRPHRHHLQPTWPGGDLKAGLDQPSLQERLRTARMAKDRPICCTVTSPLAKRPRLARRVGSAKAWPCLASCSTLASTKSALHGDPGRQILATGLIPALQALVFPTFHKASRSGRPLPRRIRCKTTPPSSRACR